MATVSVNGVVLDVLPFQRKWFGDFPTRLDLYPRPVIPYRTWESCQLMLEFMTPDNVEAYVAMSRALDGAAHIRFARDTIGVMEPALTMHQDRTSSKIQDLFTGGDGLLAASVATFW